MSVAVFLSIAERVRCVGLKQPVENLLGGLRVRAGKLMRISPSGLSRDVYMPVVEAPEIIQNSRLYRERVITETSIPPLRSIILYAADTFFKSAHTHIFFYVGLVSRIRGLPEI